MVYKVLGTNIIMLYITPSTYIFIYSFIYLFIYVRILLFDETPMSSRATAGSEDYTSEESDDASVSSIDSGADGDVSASTVRQRRIRNWFPAAGCPIPPAVIENAMGSNKRSRANTNTTSSFVKTAHIHSEYLRWAHQAPLLYEIMISRGLYWPSLTVQWMTKPVEFMPDSKSRQKPSAASKRTNQVPFDPPVAVPDGYVSRQLLLGTQTSSRNTTNSLILAEAIYPDMSGPHADVEHPHDAAGSVDAANTPTDRTPGSACQVHIIKQIKHYGDMHKVRSSWNIASLVATKSGQPRVDLYDVGVTNIECQTDARLMSLMGHTTGGWALSWNRRNQSRIISGADDSLVLEWDIQAKPSASFASGTNAAKNQVQPLHTYRKHTDVVNDVDWEFYDGNVFASVSDDKFLCYWDNREQRVRMFVYVCAGGEGSRVGWGGNVSIFCCAIVSCSLT
jgi:WD40 repeat protein